MPYDRLSPLDSVFLHVEDEHQPLHVGALAYFEREPFLDDEGRFDLARVRRRIASRLHLVPRFRKRIMTVPFDQGRPVWVDDTGFDLAYHVRLTALPAPGSEAQLKLLMDRVQAQVLDRRRPLWELWWVDGVSDDRVALIQKTHHALVDGVSGIDVATVLLDLEREVEEVDPLPWTPEPPPDAASLLVDSLVERAVEPTELARSVRAAVRVPQGVAERVGQVARSVVDLVQGTPRAPWNVPVTPHRRFEPARVPLEDAKVVRRAAVEVGDDLADVTLNDVVLTACAGAMRRYLLERGDDAPEGLVYRAMVPVSVRDVSEKMALGNRVSMMTADLPLGEPDPVERLRFVHAHMASRKEMGTAVGADTLMGLTGYAPPTLLALGSRLAVRATTLNTVITNIPGPQIPLYCLGARMLEAFPYVCVVDGLAMIIAVISYDGELAFGLSGDRSAVPDLALLAESIEASFDELAAAFGVPGRASGGAGRPGAVGATVTVLSTAASARQAAAVAREAAAAGREAARARKVEATAEAAAAREVATVMRAAATRDRAARTEGAPTRAKAAPGRAATTKATTKATAKEAAARNASTKEAAATKAAPKKAAAKKAAAKKASTKKAAAKKAAPKKAAAKKASTKKAAPKKAAPKKAAATKASRKKAAARKVTAKKAGAKKAGAKKAGATTRPAAKRQGA